MYRSFNPRINQPVTGECNMLMMNARNQNLSLSIFSWQKLINGYTKTAKRNADESDTSEPKPFLVRQRNL